MKKIFGVVVIISVLAGTASANINSGLEKIKPQKITFFCPELEGMDEEAKKRIHESDAMFRRVEKNIALTESQLVCGKPHRRR